MTPDHARIVQHPVMNHAMLRADASLYNASLDHLRAGLLASAAQALDVDEKTRSGMGLVQLQELKGLLEKMEMHVAGALKSEIFDMQFAAHRIELASRVAHLFDRHLGLLQLVSPSTG